MSIISPAEVKRLAELGRVRLTDAEVEATTKNLEDIFNNFSAIQTINTENVAPATDMTGIQNRTRDDVVTADVLCQPSVLIEAAPDHRQDYVQVRAVFEE